MAGRGSSPDCRGRCAAEIHTGLLRGLSCAARWLSTSSALSCHLKEPPPPPALLLPVLLLPRCMKAPAVAAAVGEALPSLLLPVLLPRCLEPPPAVAAVWGCAAACAAADSCSAAARPAPGTMPSAATATHSIALCSLPRRPSMSCCSGGGKLVRRLDLAAAAPSAAASPVSLALPELSLLLRLLLAPRCSQ